MFTLTKARSPHFTKGIVTKTLRSSATSRVLVRTNGSTPAVLFSTTSKQSPAALNCRSPANFAKDTSRIGFITTAVTLHSRRSLLAPFAVGSVRNYQNGKYFFLFRGGLLEFYRVVAVQSCSFNRSPSYSLV